MADRIRAGLHFADKYSGCRAVSRRQVPMWKPLKRSNAEPRWLPHRQREQPSSTSLQKQGHRRESRHSWRLWRWCPYWRCRTFVCHNRMDLLGVAGHGASLTASISRGRHAGTRRHMQYGSSGVRAVTAQPSFSKIPDYQP